MVKYQKTAQRLDFPFNNDLKSSRECLLPMEQEIPRSNNIMYDGRVARGNTYASRVETESERRNQYVMNMNKYQHISKEKERYLKEEVRKEFPDTPPPIEGRQHMDIQTESCWEELPEAEYPVGTESETQTNNVAMISRPLSPLFIPAKVGVDCCTQADLHSENTQIGTDK